MVAGEFPEVIASGTNWRPIFWFPATYTGTARSPYPSRPVASGSLSVKTLPVPFAAG